MTAGNDMSSGCARSLIDSAGFALSRASRPRRVRSDSAPKIRSSRSSLYFTMWLSVTPLAGGGQGGSVHFTAALPRSAGSEHLRRELRINLGELRGHDFAH
jgi:hypothetical protein